MKIPFEEIPAEGLEITIEDRAWFPERELIALGVPWARIYLAKKGHRVFLEGEIKVTVLLECDRCLVTYPYAIAEKFKIDLEVGDSEVTPQDEVTLDVNEMDTVFLDKPIVEVFNLLYQQIFLFLPIKKLCTNDCRGLCSKCGAVLNREPCSCPKETSCSPFAVLAEKKNK